MAALCTDRMMVLRHLAVTSLPRSGPPTVLLDKYGISARHIIAAAEELIQIEWKFMYLFYIP